MEITKREIIVSIAILFIMTSLAIMFTFITLDNHNNDTEKYHKALQLYNAEEIEFAMNTDAGYAFINVNLTSDEFVTNDKLKGEYLYIYERVEEYVRKTRIVTTTNSDGITSTRTETYWEWDVVARNETHVETLNINNYKVEFDYLSIPVNKINLSEENTLYQENITWGGSYLEFNGELFGNNKSRYSYNVINKEGLYTAFVLLEDNTIKPSSNKYISLRNNTIEEHYEMMVSPPIGWYVFIWIMWLLVTGGLIIGFYYLDNYWLNKG